jgi:hypothetical protein
MDFGDKIGRTCLPPFSTPKTGANFSDSRIKGATLAQISPILA